MRVVSAAGIMEIGRSLERLRSTLEHAVLREALENIVANARLVPDPQMQGLTDTYAVPLDDIENARKALAKATPSSETEK